MCKGQVVKLMGPLCRARSTLSLSALFDHSRGQSISASQSTSFLSGPQLFPAVSLCSPLTSSCLASSFLPSPVFSPLSILGASDLFQISKDRSEGLTALSFLLSLPPSLHLTDNQKSESAGLAALPPSFIPLSFLWKGRLYRRLDMQVCVCVTLSGSSFACRKPLCWKQAASNWDLKATLLH